MITGIRSALICDRVEVDENGAMNLFRLNPDPIVPKTTPGYLHIWVVIQAELDQRRSAVHVKVEAADFDLPAVPFDIPAGLRLSLIAYPLVIPVLRAGPLTIWVSNDERPRKPFKIRWRLELDPDAPPLDESLRQQIKARAEETSEAVAARLETLQSRKQ
jgi:hypothetical protein